MPASDRPGELQRLCEQQARDARRRRLPNRGPIVREADLQSGRHRFDLRDLPPSGRAPTKFRGRSRRVAVRDDAGGWHDTVATGRPFRFSLILLGINPWEAAVQAAVDRGDCTCPVCEGLLAQRRRLDPDGQAHCCAYCNTADTDALADAGQIEYRGLEPDSVLNPCAASYPPTPTAYRKATTKGGTK